MIAAIVRRGSQLFAGVALTAAALAACSESPTESHFVRITTDRAEYQAGTRGTATITNISDDPVYYNLCEAEIQRLTSTGWRVVARRPEDEGFVCPSIAHTLQPGASASAEFALRADLAEGAYRVRFPSLAPVEGEPSASAQASEPFRVEPTIVPF